MSRISNEKRLPKYYRLYDQIYDNPSIPLHQLTKNTGIARSTVSRYLREMYEHSILKGPMIFLLPAQNYHEHISLLKFDHPVKAYERFRGFPHLMYRSLCSGEWHLLLICSTLMNFSALKGVEACVLQEVKGATYLPKVTVHDWDLSMEQMRTEMAHPEEKSYLYEETSWNSWKEKEWTLYHQFKHNIRIQAVPILKKCQIRYEHYQKWMLTLTDFARIYPAFYPKGLKHYFLFDFLFKSDYQNQLVDILRLLPSTAVFFSAGAYLFARLAVLDRKEKDDLLSLIFQLGENGYFTEFHQAMVISTSE